MQIVMSIGIITFWISWFRREHTESWLPPGYIEHERTFVYPDSIMSLLMIISAVLLYLGNPLAEKLTLVCGGMMLFLTIIDIAYFMQHGFFAKERDGLMNLGLILSMIIMSGVMILRFISP